MNTVSNFQIRELKNLLAKETINYYKLVGYGASREECKECNSRIKELEIELESRRKIQDNNIMMDLFKDPAA